MTKSRLRSGKAMDYESVSIVHSEVAAGVTYSVAKMSFARRTELMRQVRELARRVEFFEAGQDPGQKMDASILQAEIDRLYLGWGLRSIAGLQLDGAPATPELLAESGPEDLCREALAAVRRETGLTESERKN